MLRWTPKAENDLSEIQEHIAKNFNADLAIETIVNLIDSTEKLLKKNPLSGSILESNPLFSKIVYEGNSIYYCENPKDKSLYVVYVKPRGTKFKQDRLNNKEVA